VGDDLDRTQAKALSCHMCGGPEDNGSLFGKVAEIRAEQVLNSRSKRCLNLPGELDSLLVDVPLVPLIQSSSVCPVSAV
jgi:hypothetical protein